jgi:hypothetical protein
MDDKMDTGNAIEGCLIAVASHHLLLPNPPQARAAGEVEILAATHLGLDALPENNTNVRQGFYRATRRLVDHVAKNGGVGIKWAVNSSTFVADLL